MKKMMFIGSLLATISMTPSFAEVYVGTSAVLEDVLSSHSSSRNLLPFLSLGINNMANGFYAAAEVFGVPGSANLTDHHNGAISTRTTWAYGGSILPGLTMSDRTLGYARFSVINSKFIGPNRWKVGGGLGLGIQTVLNPCWSLRAEYDYTFYGSLHGLSAPKADEFMLGILYTFYA